MKTNSKNLKNNVEQNNIQNMQKKIREQAKRLCSMQEYINTLETTIKDNQSNNSVKINQQSYDELSRKYSDLQQKYNTLFISSQIHSSNNSMTNENLNKDDILLKLKNENSELKIKLQNEKNKNKEQKNQLEFFKQNLETDIVKSGLRSCLNYLSEKLINNDKDGEEAYFEILLEINKIREENQKLNEEKNKNLEKIENFDKIDENLTKNIDIINKLNNENNNLYLQNEMLQKELECTKNNLSLSEKNLYELKDQNYLIIRENDDLRRDNNNLMVLQRENNNLMNTINELEMKINQLNNDNRSLSDYKLGYNLVLKENNEIKKLNEDLTYDNSLFEQDVYFLKTNLDKLMDVGKNNILLKNEIDELKNLLNNLKNRKQVNNVFERITELENKNKELESLLGEKEKENNDNINNKNCLNDMINNYNYKSNKKIEDTIKKDKITIKNENNKYILANKYYADLLLRILKHHIKDNINVKNILFQLLDLNHKKIILISEIDKLKNYGNNNNNKSNNIKKNYSINDLNKKKNELKKKEKEFETLNSTISYFDKELKQFETK